MEAGAKQALTQGPAELSPDSHPATPDCLASHWKQPARLDLVVRFSEGDIGFASK
jgi:hypothetical protein